MSLKPIAVLLLIVPVVSWGQLKDPRFRDEDISGTNIQVTVNTLDNGFYEYLYNVQFPEENKGTVLSVKLDITCNLDFGEVTFPEPMAPSVRYWSPDGAHVPVKLDDMERITPAITAGNNVKWGVNGYPGQSPVNLRLVSPAPPGERYYEITPYMDTTGWDYPELEEHPEIPWIDDFMITGFIEGPACDTSAPEPLYPGNRRGFESEAANQLLTYRQPTRNRWHAASEEETATFTIVYADTIDPKSFKVTPGWARQHFNPQPGTEQTVELPLKPGINKLKFEARVARSPGRPDGQALRHSEKDMDEFEIRVPARSQGKMKP